MIACLLHSTWSSQRSTTQLTRIILAHRMIVQIFDKFIQYLEFVVLSIASQIYRATMPISSHGGHDQIHWIYWTLNILRKFSILLKMKHGACRRFGAAFGEEKDPRSSSRLVLAAACCTRRGFAPGPHLIRLKTQWKIFTWRRGSAPRPRYRLVLAAACWNNSPFTTESFLQENPPYRRQGFAPGPELDHFLKFWNFNPQIWKIILRSNFWKYG
jgi:hypothetical protein